MKVIKSKPITLAEAKELLGERKGEGVELGYEQAQALEHAEKFTEMKPKEAEKLASELEEGKKLDPETAVKAVDVSPKHAETLRAIALKGKIELTDEDADAILKTIHK